ncbi:MAG: protein kinase [Myxococcaceae bacterium]|nr:protein kinase [Myxococcaceae bacterium]
MADRLGPYLLDKRIGAGGMADVFLARGPHGVCVIKRPHPHLCATPEFVRMFLDEASLLAQLNHAGIARVFDLGQDGGVFFLAMEYVPGFDLMTISLEHERQGEFIAPELAARVIADAASALHYAHEAVGTNGQPLNIIHRDVTPHNILLSTRGEVKLIDFGVAKAAQGMHKTQAGLVKGKYPYMAPEQITGQAIDRRVDVYALGLVLYELLTNARAIEGDTEVQQIDNARSARIKPVEQLRPNTPMPLRAILAGCLHPDPAGRYPTAAMVASELEGYLRTERQVVGREDLLRLFRVVAAEASHLSPIPLEAQVAPPLASPQPGSPPDDQTLRRMPAVEPHATEPSMLAQRTSTEPHFGHGTNPQFPQGIGGSAGAEGRTLLENRVPDAVAPQPAPIQLTQTALGPQAPLPAPAPIPLTSPAPAGPRPGSGGKGLVLAAVGALALLGAAVTFVLWPSATTPAVDPKGVLLAVADAGETPEPLEDAGAVAETSGEPDAGVELAQAEPDAGAAVVAPVARDPAVLSADCTPASTVVVDGKPRGATPLELQLPPGQHTVLFVSEKDGFRRLTSVKLDPGERRQLAIRAQRATLEVSLEPFGRLSLDGKVIAPATSFKEIQTWDGRHVLEGFQAELKKTVRETVDLKPDETRKVTLRFGAP